VGKGVNCTSDLVKEAKNNYMKAWRERNKEKVKRAQQRYWEKKAAKAAES